MRKEKIGLKFLETKKHLLIAFYMALLIIIGLFWSDGSSFFEGYKRILFAPGLLVTDFFAIGGVSASLINAGIMGLLTLGIIYYTGTSLSGPTLAIIFTVAGFSMFGKTPVNVWPVPVGVALSAWLRRENFRSFLLAALFGTALGPVVSHISFGIGLGYLVGIVAGIACGMVLPGLASHVLHNHQGFCLYNIGFTCGIIGMFATAILKMFGYETELAIAWHQESQQELVIVFSLYFGSMLLLGFKGIKYVPGIFKQIGSLVTDFVYRDGMDATLFNMGLVGLLGMAYISFVGGSFNGPTLGAVMTMVGFAAFGKHPRNIWPLMAGVFLAAIISSRSPAEPAVLLGALFGTALAPIAGGFGIIAGLLAGFVHLAVVLHVGTFHGGMNLYNNGFAGGLVATLFLCTIRWLHLHRKSE
ncbi:MAG: DUF1576 domain-containing protein [Candidatus Rifleibacteriota bacterium]